MRMPLHRMSLIQSPPSTSLSELKSKHQACNSSRVQPNILQENQLLAWEEVVEHTVGHSFGEGKRPFLDTLEGEEHQLEAVADDRSSSCW
uniref:Uncharacterized protein n=1 Tax=Glycine max TaxID=3847 RepID=C6SY58_SOYBN|nr:unknown [Glycine max]